MNKKLLTAAVVAALSASPAAFADATVYGSIDVGVQSVSPGSGYNGSKLFVNDTQGSGGSLIGVRAVGDLGGGMKALVAAEAGASSDSGQLDNSASGSGACPTQPNTISTCPDNTVDVSTNVKLFQRQMYGGLSGGFGTITAGRQYREIFLVGNRSAYNYTAANVGVFFLNSLTSVRQDNFVKYTSPNLNGLSLEVGFAPGEGQDTATTGGKDNGKFQEVSANYTAGPLHVGAAIGTATTQDPSPASSVDEKTTIVGGSYAFAPFKIFALYSKSENDNGASATLNRTAISLNGVYTMGAGDIVLVYGQSTNDATGVNNADSSLLALAYYHHLSKATTAYVSYGSMTNDPGARLDLARQAVRTTANGQDPTAWSFGVKTAF